ncbi:hypothetical protein PHLCEN_2v1304 [Hermanssonia centrifuga]|uniref:Transcription elongation factor Eaf N-terminal domain-containing protein n=1 Tax=Hermanssonia centrifuga TaxID=98765 RepID=A0A2R6S3M3_9APHY|nr:hypothetical protein PHLCEN_2v1304 [Hermanssonia centrifuga]
MAATPATWVPQSGTFDVAVGISLRRALKARTGGPLKNSKLPEHDVVFDEGLLRGTVDNFKPESVDSTKPGTIEVKRGKDSTSVTVERGSTQNGEAGHAFVGQETPSKETDCVLIYDEETGQFTLEKLDSQLRLYYDRKLTRAPRHPGSPLPASRPSNSTSSNTPLSQSFPRPARDVEDEFDDLVDEDAVGEPDDEFGELIPLDPPTKTPRSSKEKDISKGKSRANPMATPIPKQKARYKKEEEEESEGEIVETPIMPPPEPKPKPKPVPRPRNNVAAAAVPAPAKPKATPAPPTHPLPPKPHLTPPKETPALPKAAASTGKKRELPVETSRSIQQPRAKRPRPSSPTSSRPAKAQEKEFSLELPGGPDLSLPILPAALPATQPVPSPSTIVPAADSEEEDWDDVLPTSAPTLPVPRKIVMVEIQPVMPSEPEESEEEIDIGAPEEEFDIGALEQDLMEHLVDDDDDESLAAAVSPVAESQPPPNSGQPISLNRFAGGEGDSMFGDDYDSTSSDDSDD